jgi:hypothetical protein
MSLLKYFGKPISLKEKIADIKADIENVMHDYCPEEFNVTWYAAYDIDPKYLVYWICIQTDKVKRELNDNVRLNDKLRRLLDKHQYPSNAQKHIRIEFASKETVDRESEGNWYYHFK